MILHLFYCLTRPSSPCILDTAQVAILGDLIHTTFLANQAASIISLIWVVKDVKMLEVFPNWVGPSIFYQQGIIM
jgi:hypothetical protein